MSCLVKCVLRCKDVSYVKHTNIAGEDEFLFLPYSTFRVCRVQWSDAPSTQYVTTLSHKIMHVPAHILLTPFTHSPTLTLCGTRNPHIIDLEAALDNSAESLDLPLARWG